MTGGDVGERGVVTGSCDQKNGGGMVESAAMRDERSGVSHEATASRVRVCAARVHALTLRVETVELRVRVEWSTHCHRRCEDHALRLSRVATSRRRRPPPSRVFHEPPLPIRMGVSLPAALLGRPPVASTRTARRGR